jgi:DNA polymerase-3 subunit epsilon
MEFVALDVETANAGCSSICQVGIARFEDGYLAEEWSTLVNPEDYFDPFNVSIHGITEDMVAGSPVLPSVVEEVRGRLQGRITLCHTAFDRVAFSQACAKYHLEGFECTWLDSARVARRIWPQFARRGYGLHNVCAAIGYEFRHHDALEDAKAAAQILLAAVKETGLNVEGWLRRVEQPMSKPLIAQAGNPGGPLQGEVLVFTGALQMTRSDAARMAVAVGCIVEEGVNKRTTILVVGDQDAMKLAGHEKSSKHRKVEDLIRNGQEIEILAEKDFESLMRVSRRPGSPCPSAASS